MTSREYAMLVAGMRRWQKAYFDARAAGTGATDFLTKARDYERRVDRATREILEDEPTLFGPEEPRPGG